MTSGYKTYRPARQGREYGGFDWLVLLRGEEGIMNIGDKMTKYRRKWVVNRVMHLDGGNVLLGFYPDKD